MRAQWMITAALSALIVSVSPGGALAQGGGGGGGGGGGAGGGAGGGSGAMSPGMQTPRGDVDRTRDRLKDRDPLGDRDQDRDRDRTRDKDVLGDRDRDRDRLHSSQVVNDQLTSLSLLSSAERSQFQSQMRAATTAEQRSQIRAEHQQIIQERAREMGLQNPGGSGAGNGNGGDPMAGMQARNSYMLMQMLSEQERSQYFNRLRSAQTQQERLMIRNEMHETAQQRAREMGVDVPEWYGGPAPR